MNKEEKKKNELLVKTIKTVVLAYNGHTFGNDEWFKENELNTKFVVTPYLAAKIAVEVAEKMESYFLDSRVDMKGREYTRRKAVDEITKTARENILRYPTHRRTHRVETGRNLSPYHPSEETWDEMKEAQNITVRLDEVLKMIKQAFKEQRQGVIDAATDDKDGSSG